MKLFIAFLIFTAALVYVAGSVLETATSIASAHITTIEGVAR